MISWQQLGFVCHTWSFHESPTVCDTACATVKGGAIASLEANKQQEQQEQ